MKILRSSWYAGATHIPVGGTPGVSDRSPLPELLVSVTDFTADRALDLPGIARAGFRLRREWPELDGAVGVWLWTIPLRRRAGSVAVWRDEEVMRRFVGLPVHVAIMRHYQGRGSTRSAHWHTLAREPEGLWAPAEDYLRRG